MTLGLVGMIAVKAGESAGSSGVPGLTGLSWQSTRGWGSAWLNSASSHSCCCFQLRGDVISEQNYNRTLFIALGTLIATPLLLKFGVRFLRSDEQHRRPRVSLPEIEGEGSRVLIVGAGPIGRDVAAYLETSGWRDDSG